MKDSVLNIVDNWTEDTPTSNPTSQPEQYHKWDTRDKPFTEYLYDTTDVIIPTKGLPHPYLSVGKLREWCLPLKVNDEDGDIIGMAQSVQTEIETHAHVNLKDSLGEELEANVDTIRSIRSEALKY